MVSNMFIQGGPLQPIFSHDMVAMGLVEVSRQKQQWMLLMREGKFWEGIYSFILVTYKVVYTEIIIWQFSYHTLYQPETPISARDHKLFIIYLLENTFSLHV